jgi:tetratricopeptide (TPR) repeat protein
MPSEREYEQVLQKEPANGDAFVALRKAYRESNRFDKLVTLYETRAQAIDDQAKAAELFYLAAEVRLDHLSDTAGAEADLAHAVSRDASHRKAAKRLKDIYREQGRTDEYLTMLEMEAAAVMRVQDAARIEEIRTEAEQAAGQEIQRIARAVSTPALRGSITADNLKTVEQARKIFAAIGEYPTACRLFELELAATTDPKRRANLTFRLGRMLAEKVGDLQQAAQRLSDVVRLYPRDDKALDALAAVFANPQWTGADGPERAAGLYTQIARRRHEAGDIDNAVAALRKALGAVPSHTDASALMERVLTSADRLADLDRFLRERAATARTDQEKIEVLFKRAQLARTSLNDMAEATRIYQEIVALEPPGGTASQELATLYLGRQDYGKLAELRERQLEKASDPEFRLNLQRELASLYRDRLGDREQAAVYLHAILQARPSDPEALHAYAEHFRQRGAWRELADVLEFALSHARSTGAAVSELLPRWEEVAVIAETKLGDVDRALAVWRQMVELDPTYQRAREACKRILQKAGRWEEMAKVLIEDAAASDPSARAEILRRLARLCLDKLDAPDRAATAYREILALDPKDVVALRAVVEAYERSEQWSELAALLRSQVELASVDAERINLLRRLLGLYAERLSDLSSASWAAAQILKLLPGDRDALQRLESIFERTDDKPKLIKILEYHLRYAAAGEEKLGLVRRIADVLQNQVDDFDRAVPYWENVLKHVPGDQQALQALLAGYEKAGRLDELARTLDLQIAALATDPSAQAELLRRLARLASDGLKQAPRAQQAWQDLLKILPTDREGLEALSAIASAQSDWSALADLLARRIALLTNPAEAAPLALQRANLLVEKLDDSAEAIRELEHVISDLDPASVEAHQALRRVAEAGNDWPRVVSVAERQLTFATDPKERVARALEIGCLYRDRLKDAKKAIGAFERVVEIEPEQSDALAALAPLYAETKDGEAFIATAEKVLRQTEDATQRRRLLFDMAGAAETMLGEARRAFELFRRAYVEGPDEEALARLEATAEAHGLWEDLIKVYAGEGARSADPLAQVQVAMKVAGLCESRLQQPARAFTVLREALAHDPAAEILLPELERLARTTKDWQGLLDVYAQVARGRSAPEERFALLCLRAGVRETEMGDPSGALDELLRAFAVSPGNESARPEILRLAEATGRWEDALAVEGQAFTQAATAAEKVSVVRRAAALVEDKVKDRVRAFRAYLNAFRLAPEDEEIAANLWRLGFLIGRYEEAEPQSAPAAALAEPQETTSESEVAEVDLLTPAPVVVVGAAAPLLEFDEVTGEIDIGELDIVDQADLPEPTAGGVPAAARFETPWQEWVQAYELLPADLITRHHYLKKQAEIWERGAHNNDLALATLERAFILQTTDESVRAEMERLAREGDGWDHVCEIYLRAAERAARPEAIALHLRVGQIREELGQVALAEERYRSVIVLETDNPVALDRLEQMHRSRERWAELAQVLERRITVPGGRLEGAEARSRAFELAELYEKRLERPYEAVDTLERYVASTEEEERGLAAGDPRSPALALEARAGYASLARLYGRVGMAQKAAAALQRELELTGEGEDAREARWRLAEIYERELSLPARAVDMYEDILKRAPRDAEALAALDRLQQALGRFEALVEVLRRRAEISEGTEKNELVWRRARILEEKLGNPEAAAACLRSLGSDALSDERTAAALLRNLRSAGLAHEALRILEQRIGVLAKAGNDPKLIAALNLEMAQLKSDDLSDPKGAQQAIEAALALQPEDPGVLAALARFHLKRNDFQAYAAALLRRADALAGQPEQAAALLEAGAVFRDQLGQAAKARACFEKAVKLHPSNPEVLAALAAMLAGEGRIDEAKALYERQLSLCDSPSAKAAVLTNLARALCEKPDGLTEAERRLDEALDLDPNHLPAVVTMADILYREEQWDRAERRLNEALRRMRGQPEQTAKLYHRLGEVYEKLGRLDEGYRQLVEADKALPGQLMLRIALGENRFQARRWRDAATHFEGIAEHAAAPNYPEEVALALAHGAMAELRQKRPERAAALHAAALHLSPSHPQTLRALADLAIERGDKLEAARSLRQVAESCGDPAEQGRLYEQIGDLHLSLGNTGAAREAYEEAVARVEGDSPDQVPLLEKTMATQRGEGALRAAIETARRIADIVGEPKERAARRREIAGFEMEQGNFDRAADLLEQVIADDSTDETALRTLCEAYERAGRGADVGATLQRVLPQLAEPAADAELAHRRAELWAKLGALLVPTDPAAAVGALQAAITADPNRVEARLALAEIYGARPEHREMAIENHKAILVFDPIRQESLHALAAEHIRLGHIDRARCLLEVLDLLRLATDEDKDFLAQNPAPERKPDDPYAGTLEDGGRGRYLDPLQDLHFMAEVLAAVWEGAPGLSQASLDSFGVTAKDKVSTVADLAIAQIWGQAGKALGNRRTSLYLRPDADFDGVSLVGMAPPAIVVGPRLAGEAVLGELRFRIGRALELSRPEYLLAATLPAPEFDTLFMGVLKAFHPKHARFPAGSEDAAAEQAARLKKALPYKIAKRVGELFQEHADVALDPTRWREGAREAGNRAGLLMCGVASIAVRMVGRESIPGAADVPDPETLREHAGRTGPLRELLRFAVSDAYLDARDLLGLGRPAA